MENELVQFIPLIIVIAVVWIVVKYLRNKKGITDRDDGSKEVKEAAFKAGKSVNKSLLANKKLIQIGAGIILAIIIYQYLSPYHSCKRDMKKAGGSTAYIEKTCRGKWKDLKRYLEAKFLIKKLIGT